MGLLLTLVGGYFSVIGLATIFAGAFWSVIVMATALELSKVVAASWIYRCWSIAPLLIKFYMISSIIILVGITSLGIFGYLSKAHVDQELIAGGNNELRIEGLERRIANEKRKINDAEKIVNQLDSAVQILMDNDRIRGQDGAIAVRQLQQEERQSLNATINDAHISIESYQEELTPLLMQQNQIEAKVGPLKYLAEMMYGTSDEDVLGKSVRWLTIILVIVFDPLAIVLILAGNVGIASSREKSGITMMTGEELMRNVDLRPYVSKEGHGLN
jgi:hypothetical protein